MGQERQGKEEECLAICESMEHPVRGRGQDDRPWDKVGVRQRNLSQSIKKAGLGQVGWGVLKFSQEAKHQ